MYIQAQVLEWLKTLDINRIKHFLTLKNSSNISYIKRILMTKPQTKPIDRISHGYADNKYNNQKSISHIYFRQTYRYKKRKQQKMAMDKILFENITVSRLNPWAFSLKKAFIKSKDFARCMLLFSDEQIFNYTDLKQTPVKLGKEKQLVSIWFDPSHIKSFSQWLVYLFQMEIFQAYELQKSSKVSLISELSYFSYVSENITKQQIKSYLENTLYILSEKRFNGKFAKKSGKKQIFFSKQQEQDEEVSIIQVSVQEVPYLLTRCLQKFQDTTRNIDQIVFQYEWYSQDRRSKVNRIIKDICRVISRKYKEFQLDVKAKQIEALGQTGKKKKKRGTKKINVDNDQDQNQTKQQKSEQKKQMNSIQSNHLTPKKEQQNATQQTGKIQKVAHQKDSEENIIQCKEKESFCKPVFAKKEEIRQSLQLTPVKSNKKRQKQKQKLEILQQQQKSNEKKIQKQIQKVKITHKPKQTPTKGESNDINEKQDRKLKKKIVNERINEHILSYYHHICQSSQAIDKYRKICIELIEKTISEMGLKVKWQLILFGSYSVDFALRQSDLDLVVVSENDQSLSLHRLYEHFKVKQWLRQCNIIQIQSAKVPILEFQIILSCLKHPKLKDVKKVSKDVIHVDITMSLKRQTHEGIRNTNIMNNIFSMTPNLRNIGLIFKQLLRIYDLNKPFKGGIGSYVLIILLHNILNIQSVEINEEYACQMMIICHYMSEKFEPYKTLISPFKKSELAVNPKLQLNLEDPEDHVLINTTKMRQINEIILLFKQFQHLLLEIEQTLMNVNTEERKKMKRIFFEKWNVLFKPHEDIAEHQK